MRSNGMQCIYSNKNATHSMVLFIYLLLLYLLRRVNVHVIEEC
jgi:hypothetical protein